MQTSIQEKDQRIQSVAVQQQQQPAMQPVVQVSEGAGGGGKDAAGFAIPSLPASRNVQHQRQQEESTDGIPQDVRTIMQMMGLDGGALVPEQETTTTVRGEPEAVEQGDA